MELMLRALEAMANLRREFPEHWFTEANLEMSNTGLQDLDFLLDPDFIPSMRKAFSRSISRPDTFARHRQRHRLDSSGPHLEEADCKTSTICTPDPDDGLHQPGSSMNGYRFILRFISAFNSHPTYTASSRACSV